MICQWCGKSYPKRKGRFCGTCYPPNSARARLEQRLEWATTALASVARHLNGAGVIHANMPYPEDDTITMRGMVNRALEKAREA